MKKHLESKGWINAAVQHPGALHAQLGVPQGSPIPAAKLAAALSGADGALAEKRARLAQTLEGMHH